MYRVFSYALVNLILLGFTFWNALLCAYWAVAYTVTGTHRWFIGDYSTDKLIYSSVAFLITGTISVLLGSATSRVAQEETAKIQKILEDENV